MITAERYHDVSIGHRVHGHEGKCALLHGHNYRIHFTCAAEYIVNDEIEILDRVGRVIDFSAIKARLCLWLEDNWDHKFLAWDQDTWMEEVVNSTSGINEPGGMLRDSIVWVPFNPTAENIALHLLHVVGPQQLADTRIRVVSVRVDETRKCSATATL